MTTRGGRSVSQSVRSSFRLSLLRFSVVSQSVESVWFIFLSALVFRERRGSSLFVSSVIITVFGSQSIGRVSVVYFSFPLLFFERGEEWRGVAWRGVREQVEVCTASGERRRDRPMCKKNNNGNRSTDGLFLLFSRLSSHHHSRRKIFFVPLCQNFFMGLAVGRLS